MFIGKWDSNGHVLTVQQHLRDTGGVMDYLLHHFVAKQTIRAAGLSETEFRALSIFCALVHDIGKCTPAFQYKTANRQELLSEGFEPDYVQATPHNIAGGAILHVVYGVPDEIADIIAAHHGNTRKPGKQEDYKKQFSKYAINYFVETRRRLYEDAWNEIYEYAIDQSGMMFFPVIEVGTQILITGLVTIADWIASNDAYFPYDKAENQEKRLKTGIEKIKLPSLWNPEYINLSADDFSARFGFMPNILQRTALDIAANSEGSGLMIIESTMGTGKTESALTAAEILSTYSGSGGVFFGLPTQATANGLFPRVTSWAGIVSEGMSASIRLAHGDAWNNEYYRELSISDSSGITVNQWLSGRHRTLLPDFVVGTVDQILMAGLKQKFFTLLHLGMSGKTIIIDEVHSYDAYMDIFLEVVLAWLGYYHASVILLSATLTDEKRRNFIEAYSGVEAAEINRSYPSITWADQSENKAYRVNFEEQDKQVQVKHIAYDEIAYLVIEAVKDGGCAGVIVNTVDKAQKLAGEIRAKYEYKDKVILLHARYLPEDRARIERHVQNLVGKASGSRERDHTIIIGTQVLEQSLDIDFDVLFTEICPMDLLIQRVGRLHRHPIHDKMRTFQWRKSTCFLFEQADQVIYDAYIIRRTREVLPDVIRLPSDIKPLIEQVYDLDQGSDAEDKNVYQRHIREMKIHARDFLIPLPSKCRSFKGLTEGMEHIEGVRYKINNISCLLIKKDTDGTYSTVGGEQISQKPDPEEKALIGRQKINLFYTKGMKEALELQGKPEWSGIFYEHLMILDSDNSVELDGVTWNYSFDYGLRRMP